MKVALVDSASLSPWIDSCDRFDVVERVLQNGGHSTIRIDAGLCDGRRPILVGWGREGDVKPLIESLRAFERVKQQKPDLCIVPLRGGLAHGLLMARACGELPASMRIAIVAEEPSRSVALRSDILRNRLQPLVADAMERFCIENADLLIADDADTLPWLATLDLAVSAPVDYCLQAPVGGPIVVTTSKRPDEVFFIGRFDRENGVVAFIDAVERLFAAQRWGLKRINFIGPIDAFSNAPGKEWLGLRAMKWPFEFSVFETHSLAEACAKVRGTRSLAFFANCASEQIVSLFGPDVQKIRLRFDILNASSQLYEVFVAALENDKTDAVTEPMDKTLPCMEALVRRPPRVVVADAMPPLSVCILHHDRPGLLKRAIDSVLSQSDAVQPAGVDVIVFDNGSIREDSKRLLDELSTDPRLSVVREPHVLPHPAAMNAMVSHATRPYVVFLDDDNLIASGGIAALRRAIATNHFDVVVSNMEIFDATEHEKVESVGTMAFIGQARTAGLFFNGFGDTCMVFKRAAFERLGGFLDTKAPSPAPDWLLLARAQAAGLKIGVLQEAAFWYRRNIETAGLSWQKYDQHGLRDLLLRHYGDVYDARLLAKLSQALLVDFV